MKRILFFHEEFPCGGAERITIDIANFLSAFDYEIFLVCCRKKREVAGIQIIELPDKKDANSLINADAFVKIINDFSIDLFVLPVSLLKHIDYIMHRVSCKLVFASHSIPLWEAIAKVAHKKKIAQSSSWLKKLEWYFITYPKANWFHKYERHFLKLHEKMYQQADAYVILCEDYKNELIRRLKLPFEKNKFKVIPNSEKPVLSVNSKKKKQILFVGRLTYVDKRVDRLIDIWEMIYKQVPDWELRIVGEGPEKEKLQKQAADKKLERVHFLGYKEDVSKCYSEASVLCLTSTFEGWGLCLTEAQANGVVPIAYDCCAGVHDIISPSGVNGYLVPPFSKRKFAKVLLQLLKHPEELEQMQKNVVVKVRKFAPDNVGKKWKDLFESLLEE